ncbi:MAG: hypothetical protein L3J96_01180 [Thermoplasmata archaeon]|nr:hypothetical protein [Thermoplasmata archaeon]
MSLLVPTSRFNQRLRWKNSHQRELVPRIEAAMRKLEASDRPESLGRMKHGRLARVYGFDVGRESRILYRVDRTAGEIRVVLLRVCSHAEVYTV